MNPDPALGVIPAKRRSSNESFRDGGRTLHFDLLGFWQWSCSDLVSNATRGVLAEYLVAQALGVTHGVREEWAAYDITTPDGTLIEVKSASYLQSWHQERPSKISFLVPRTRAWDKETNRQSSEMRRQAHVYVFALLAHLDKATIEPLDVAQWEFFVLPTVHLDNRTRSQHSISLRSLRTLAGPPVAFHDLGKAVEGARRLQETLANKPKQPTATPTAPDSLARRFGQR